MDVSGNTVFITGGTSGIGLCLATQLVAAGNEVVVCGRSEEKLAAAAATVEGLHTIRCDIADEADVEACLERLASDFPNLNVLVNNAGVFHLHRFGEGDDALDLAVQEMTVNYFGTLRLIKRMLPRLSERPRAAIVNVTSGLAYIPFAAAPTYSATKAALHSFTQSLRHQLKDSSVQIFEVLPPVVDTPMTRDLEGIPKMPPDKVAAGIIKGLRKGKPEIPIGISKALRAMRRLAPGTVFKALNKGR
ncbi:MAG: SDR family NAD(P)-dependent oxidoreductase [Myxococcota bacterium]